MPPEAYRARLSTGETVPADLIVAGTGWRQAAPFFDAPTTARITDKDGNFRLFRSMVPIGVKNLAFNGYNSSFFSQLNCEIGALWIAEMLRGGLSLPSEDVQNRHVDDRLEWMCARTDGKHSKGTNIIPFSVHHIDELLNDMGINLSGPKKLRQWLAPVDPGDYRHLLKMLKSRPVVRREVRV